MKMINLRFACLLTICALTGTQAAADAIDGHWCHKDGRRMSIEGPRFVTPGGNAIEGEYDRHGFTYSVPAGEPHAGARVTMDLVDDDIVTLHPPQPAATETWQRCDLTM